MKANEQLAIIAIVVIAFIVGMALMTTFYLEPIDFDVELQYLMSSWESFEMDTNAILYIMILVFVLVIAGSMIFAHFLTDWGDGIPR